MNEIMQITTKDSLRAEMEARKLSGGLYAAETVTMAETKLGKNINKLSQADAFKLAFSAKTFGEGHPVPKITGKYGSVLAAPFKWYDGKTESVMDRIGRKAFASANSNSLIPDWQQLWEIMRIDLTSRKTANPTIRQFLYNMLSRPDADKTNKIVDFLPWFVKFQKLTGNGDPLPLGYRGGALIDTFDIEIYGAAFVWTLLAALFDKSLDLTQMSDAVAVGYSSLQDDLALAPILAYNYSTAGTAKHTAASTTAGADKYQLLYETLENAVEDLAKRSHPVITTQPIAANDLVYLGSTNSARHVAKVVVGLPGNVETRPFMQLSEISRIVGYDGEATHGYSGVGDTYGYLVKRNEFMNIVIKRGLTAEIDLQPDVKTLAQEERAWWFAEGVAAPADYGYGAFIQKITLPTW
jgi:hypothetical protein